MSVGCVSSMIAEERLTVVGAHGAGGPLGARGGSRCCLVNVRSARSELFLVFKEEFRLLGRRELAEVYMALMQQSNLTVFDVSSCVTVRLGMPSAELNGHEAFEGQIRRLWCRKRRDVRETRCNIKVSNMFEA